MTATVVGAGLAGCEAAWALAERGVHVRLCDMKPQKYSPAHRNPDLAELVCSNSFGASRVASAAGMLKEELRRMGSLLISVADSAAVPAGGALAVDREQFSAQVTAFIQRHPLIETVRGEVTDIPDGFVIVATGPLTSPALSEAIVRLVGEETLSFYDAAAPIVTMISLDHSRVFPAARYGLGGDDYLNCPLDKTAYEAFVRALSTAGRAPVHGVDADTPPAVYEACIPVEILASRGPDTLRFGLMKPVGLTDPATGRRPYAAVQLRRENVEGTLYNLVGFQTGLRFGEQKRVFSMIPGLECAEFVRYGVMHRNTFICSPKLLDRRFCLRAQPRIYFAGQITGVEGYVESAMSGLIAGVNLARALRGEAAFMPDETTLTGALCRYISDPGRRDFQPMGASMGLLPPLSTPERDRAKRYAALAERGLSALPAV